MISERLRKIILDQLNLERVAIGETTTAAEVPGWDSLAHVKIILAVESEFGIRCKGLEIIKLRTIMDLQRLVDSKCAK